MNAIDGRHRGGDGRELLLAVPPGEILDHQNAQAAEQMDREQENEPAFGELDQRLIGPAQEAVEPRLAVDGEAERQKMKRQENRQRQPGKRDAPWRRSTARCRDALSAARSRQHHRGDGARAEQRQ